jgi:putative PIN family toxin of toxin-antitoxin system
MRIVFDTNVLFAAFVARSGLCARIVEEALARHEVFLSQFIVLELARNLEQKAGVDKSHINNAIASLVRGSAIVEPAEVSPSAVGDPKDVAILGTAAAAHADVLISGDNDLLSVGSFEAVTILSPRQFYDRFVLKQP